jgi:hypothetical protein
MDIERVGPSGPSSASEKKGRKSTPDSEEFKEMMKTGKVGEPEFEKPKKRRSQGGEEEEPSQISEPLQKSKPATTTPFSQPRINISKESSQVQPPQEQQKEVFTEEDKEKKVEKKEKAKEKKKKEFAEVVVYKKGEKKVEEPSIKEEKIEELTVPEEKIFIKEMPKPEKEIKKEEKKAAQKIPSFPKKEEIASTKEKKPSETLKKEEFKHEISTVLQEMPFNIASQTESLTSALSPYLHPDIVPLFEKMVGTIIHIQAGGITRTQVILNSPAFTSSIFFGSSIVLEKYSTAPDSFNIFLRGPQEAVAMFNDNLDGLLDAFKRGNFNFKIGRLEAEHERPLFKRKEKAKGDDSETGTKK